MNNSYKQHWENVFSTKAENEVSCFQPYPKTSMEFVGLFNLPLDANIIDIGGGDSHFVDALLDKGYQNIYVLDISANAIERVCDHRLINYKEVLSCKLRTAVSTSKDSRGYKLYYH